MNLSKFEKFLWENYGKDGNDLFAQKENLEKELQELQQETNEIL